MRSQKNRRTNQRTEQINRNVIRCQKLMRPVYESDTCQEFSGKTDSESTKLCKNCKHAN